MRMRLFVCWLFAGFLFVLPGLTGNAFSYSEQDPMVLKCGIATPPNDVYSQTIKRLGDQVEEKSKGRFKFQYFYGESLIKKPAFVDAVAKGIADISVGPVSFITGKMPELSILEIYGAYKLGRFEDVVKAVDPTLQDVFKPAGVRVIMYHYPGPAIFSHKNKFMKTVDDWKGEKMRLGGKWQSTLAGKWGASPMFMPPGELYLAVQRGIINGFMLVWDVMYGLNLYEVAPYVTDSEFSLNLELITMNLKKWESLTPEDRKIFEDAGKEVTAWGHQEIINKQKRIEADITGKGCKVHHLTPQEKGVFLKDAFSLWPEVRSTAGPAGNKLADILETMREN
jgi:TRAP-type transport system periplasmic protein